MALSVLDKHGIDKAFVMGGANLYNSTLCAQDNDHLAELGRKSDRFLPLCTAWPQDREKGVAEIARCIEKLAMKGLKFHPKLQGFSTADEYLHKMCGRVYDKFVGEIEVS